MIWIQWFLFCEDNDYVTMSVLFRLFLSVKRFDAILEGRLISKAFPPHQPLHSQWWIVPAGYARLKSTLANTPAMTT